MKHFAHLAFWLTVLGSVAAVTAGSWWLKSEHDKMDVATAAEHPAGEAVPAGEEPMDSATRQLTGLRVEPLTAAVWKSQVRALGHVVDPGPLVSLWTEHDMIVASLRASEADVERDRQLYARGGGVSRGLLDQAEAVVATDRLKKENILHRLRFEWGAFWVRPQADLMEQLLAGTTMLVRAELASSIPLKEPPAGAQVVFPGQESAAITALRILPAASIDAKVQGSAWMLVIPGGAHVPAPGTAAQVVLHTAGHDKNGIVIPSSAVVQFEGRNWAFIEDGQHPGKFGRRMLSTDRPMSGGYFVEDGFTAGEAVVTTAPALLLARQTLDQTAGEE